MYSICKTVNHINHIKYCKLILHLLFLLYVWKASLLFIVMSYENEIINFNGISQYCHPVCILIYFDIKKLNHILNNNLIVKYKQKMF